MACFYSAPLAWNLTGVDIAESQKNVKYLLEMIESIAPTHYQGLEKLSA